MGNPRPLDGTDKDIAETANGPTVDNEAELLAEEFGEPDEEGVYGGDSA
jgi:hypothetical protein